MKYYCGNCKKDTELDQNARCPHCEAEYLADIISDVLSEDSKCYLSFFNNSNAKYANKIDLNNPKSYIRAGAVVTQVTKEFFDKLTPQVHHKTPEGGYCGGVIISKESDLMQLILSALNNNAVKLDKPLGNLPKEDSTQLSIDIGESLNSSLQPDWKARTKSFLDNELFVDFD